MSCMRTFMRIVEDAARISPDDRAKALGFTVPAFHGTKESFDAFDPRRTGDIGLHFGTARTANDAIMPMWRKPGDDPWHAGSNIIPVLLKLRNPLRVKDMFSTLKTTFTNRAKQWTLHTPGFHPNDAERAAIYDAAKSADRARRAGGGDWSIQLDKSKAPKLEAYNAASRRFWQAIEASCKRQGYDGLVYTNKVEGRGDDSYVVFDASQVRARHASFQNGDSDLLMDQIDPET